MVFFIVTEKRSRHLLIPIASFREADQGKDTFLCKVVNDMLKE